ncbi:MAG TPA: hypothetical protein VJ865_03415 [Gemmatimonadaceae bacterium]|nr:hypothetical protein [Gemmatimonadaceae bacterium]
MSAITPSSQKKAFGRFDWREFLTVFLGGGGGALLLRAGSFVGDIVE